MAGPKLGLESGGSLGLEGGDALGLEGLGPPPPPVPSAPPRDYDILAAIDALFPGLVVQRELIDAAWLQWQANGFTPLLAAQVPAILAAANLIDVIVPATPADNGAPPTTRGVYPRALPPYPKGLPRFPDSNPDPFDGWTKYGDEAAAA